MLFNRSSFPHGFANGITVREIPIILTQGANGNVFWVDSVHGSNGNKGTFKLPFATLAFAITQCTANHEDKIILAEGHAEDIVAAAGIALNIAGVSIYFMGQGASKAAITFKTLTTATMTITADGVTLVNPKFVSGLDAVATAIVVTGANCQIINAEWHDAAAKAVTRAIVLNTGSDGTIIDGWKYFVSTTGTQKQSQIKVVGLTNIELRNINIDGDFGTGNIENTAAATNFVLDGVYCKNQSTTPTPAMTLHASTTGIGKNIDLRIYSGATYVSSVAKMNWDSNCLGYSADGHGGDPIGTADNSSIEAKLDNIQTDIGDPSARTNFKSVETMLGMPDAVNSNLDDMLRTGFDSSAVGSNVDGSVMERLEYIQGALTPTSVGFTIIGDCDAGMVASPTSIVSLDLAGYGDDYFNNKYYMQVIRNNNSHGTSPELLVRKITDYTSTTGTFVVDTFGDNVEASDSILVMHESVVMAGRNDADNVMSTSAVVANADGSLVERDQYNQEAIAAVQTDIGDPSARTNFKSLETMIGIPDAANSCVDDILRTGYDSTAITANADGSVLERLEFVQSKSIPDLGGLVFSGDCDATMVSSTTAIVCANLAGYGDDFFNTKYYMQVIRNANSAGNAPEMQVRQITNYVSTTGTFTVTAFGAVLEATDSVMVVHESIIMLGRDDNDNTMATTNVVANADGSIVEREEYLQTLALAIKAVTDVLPDAGALTALLASIAAIKAVTDVIPNAGALTTIDTNTKKIDSGALSATPTAGSLCTFISSGSGAAGTALAASKSLIDALGTDGTTATVAKAASASSLFGAIGTNEVDATTPFTSANVQANADGTVLEREEYIQSQADKIDKVTLGTPVAASLASFVASGGVGLGTQLATSKSLIDALGTDGTTATVAKAASASSLFGAIGTNEVDATTPFTSAAVQANADGTVLEREEFIQDAIAVIDGNTDKIDSATLAISPTAGSLARFIASGGTALGSQLGASKSIIDALGSNGVAAAAGTCASAVSLFGAIGTNETDVTTPFTSAAVEANADGTVLEREEYIQAQTALVKASSDKIDSATLAISPTAGSLARFIASGGTALGTALADSKSLVDALGTNGTTVADSAVSVLGAIGANNANNAFLSDAVVADADGSVLEREQYIQAEVDKIDAVTLAVNPAAGSLARFVASGGTALGTPLADSKSLMDAIGTDGTTALAGTCASASSLFGAIGTNEADASTPFTSANVQANADGTVLEREEYIQAAIAVIDGQTDKIDGAALSATPTAGSLATFISAGSGAVGTALGASKSLVDAIGSNGITLAYGAGSVLGAVGTSFWIKKTLTSSGITFATAVDLTGVSSVGELAIDMIILKTDVTGLATGTNFEIKSDNAKGLANICVEAIANLGANKTITLDDASVSHTRTILETGKKLQAQNTIADGTGAGTIDIYVKFIRLSAGATISAV